MAAVNYITEHEAFIVYAQDNGLSASEQLLWYALIHLFNERAKGSQWPDGFIRITNKTLMGVMPYSVDAIAVARNQLKQRGLIDYVPGRKKADIPMYRINYFSCPQAEEDDDPGFYTEKTDKGADKHADKPTDKGADKAADIIDKHNGDLNLLPDADDDPRARETEERLRKDLTETLVESWCDAFGQEPIPGAAGRIVQAALILETRPAMIEKAVELASYNGARSPGPYIVSLLKIWHDNCIYTPEEWDAEQLARRTGGRSAEQAIADREARRQKHRGDYPWP